MRYIEYGVRYKNEYVSTHKSLGSAIHFIKSMHDPDNWQLVERLVTEWEETE